MPDRTASRRAVERFADELLAVDLPELPDTRRHQAVEFVGRRIPLLPSPTRLGVSAIALLVDGLGRLAGPRRLAATLGGGRLALPLLSEYPRLVRSLAYAFVWEQWPDTKVTGAP